MNRKNPNPISRWTAIVSVVALSLVLLSISFLLNAEAEGVDPQIAEHSDLSLDHNPQVETIDYSVARKLRYVNLHCTATRGDVSKKWLLDFFKYERGFSKPGYNLAVQRTGQIDTLVKFNRNGYVEYNEISYGVRGKNSVSINVAYIGGVDRNLKPLDTRTPEQIRALDSIVESIRAFAPHVLVRGHRDHPNVRKACPSFEVSDRYKDCDRKLVEDLTPDSLYVSFLTDTLGMDRDTYLIKSDTMLLFPDSLVFQAMVIHDTLLPIDSNTVDGTFTRTDTIIF